ncbi:MAG: hypothetical protein ACI4A3_02545 [Lachnospiraceae bacterium]
MNFLQSGHFFGRIKGNVIKWWQQILLPVLKINNNRDQGRGGWKQQENITPVPEPDQKSTIVSEEEISGLHEQDEDQDTLRLAQQKAEQMQREDEKRRKEEIEQARRKVQEQERIASIMDANKVDVNAFIQAGKEAQKSIREQADQKEQQHSAAEHNQDEDMRRAQEIIDRLNREAAEDEAKKQAEIEAAKQKAKETFG